MEVPCMAACFTLLRRTLWAIMFLLAFLAIIFLVSWQLTSSTFGRNSDEMWLKVLPKIVDLSYPLGLLNDSLVLLVSHELSLSDGPLFLMELAFLLRSAGAKVCWITNQRSSETDAVIYSLEHRLLDRGVKVLPAKGEETISTALQADLLVLNTVMAGKWLDHVLKEKVSYVLPKVLWWIHEMQDHHFQSKNVKHLPKVSGIVIGSHIAAEYWKNKIRDLLRTELSQLYVVPPGNSEDLMEIAVNSVARRVLREHVRESLGLQHDDVVFAMINSVSEEKGQDLFLQSFHESLQLIRRRRSWVPSIHAVIVGIDINAETIFELKLRGFTRMKKIEDRVHFVSKSLTVIPYLAAIDVLVQNSQAPGECFGRIIIEAMAFNLPVLGTAVGGTTEIVVNESTGLLHPTGAKGVIPLANNIVTLATQVYRRVEMGQRGYEKVEERFLDSLMEKKIAVVIWAVLQKAKIMEAKAGELGEL